MINFLKMYTNNENIINIYIYKTKNKSARLRGSKFSYLRGAVCTSPPFFTMTDFQQCYLWYRKR